MKLSSLLISRKSALIVFFNCKSLQKVVFSKNSELQSIGKKCFMSTSINKLKIPSHVRKISEMAFALCEKLKKNRI